MPLSPEQALDEATHRKVEGSFDELQRAARNIEKEARSIESAGGEQRLVDLLDKYSGEVRAMLKNLMSEAYYRPREVGDPPPESRPKRQSKLSGEAVEEEQKSLFINDGDDALVA